MTFIEILHMFLKQCTRYHCAISSLPQTGRRASIRSIMGIEGDIGEGSGVGVEVEGGERGKHGDGGGGGGGDFGEEEEEVVEEEGEAGSWGGHVLQLRSWRSLKKSFGVKT